MRSIGPFFVLVMMCGVALPFAAACASDPAASPLGDLGDPGTPSNGGALAAGGSSAGGLNGGVSTSAGTFASAGSTASAGATNSAGASSGSGGTGSNAGSSGASGSTGGGNTGGATTSGGAGPGGDSRCSGLVGATSCDGFENAAPGAMGSDWTVIGSPVVDTTNFYRGKKSLKYSSTGAASFIVNKKVFSGTTKATNNELWGRYFILAGVSAHSAGHSVFGALVGADKLEFHFVGGSRERLMAEIRIDNSDHYTNSGQKEPTTAAPPFPVKDDGWQCWEFHVTADDSYAFYINGNEVTDMRITKGIADASKKTFPLPVFSQIQLGWQSFSGTVPVSGWIDEVAMGPSRITCEM